MSAWIASIITSGALAVLLWLCRNLIATRLTKSVEHEFNLKLEAVRAELREKDNAIASLRSGALTAMASRQVALEKRTLEAVDQLWSALTALAGAKTICNMVSVFKFEAITAEDAKHPGMREVFATIDKGYDIEKTDTSGAQKARPYVSPMAWALYSAYSAIVMQAVTRVKLVKSGLGATDLIRKDYVGPLIKAALPHQAEFVDKFGDLGNYLHLDELEAALLAEFKKMFAGEETDKATIVRAAEVVRLTNALNVAQACQSKK